MQHNYSNDHHSVLRLQEFCRGKELQHDAVGALARFFRDGPGGIAYKTVDDLKTACGHYGPNVTMEEVDVALIAAGLEVES